jgi:hypothetical protein
MTGCKSEVDIEWVYLSFPQLALSPGQIWEDSDGKYHAWCTGDRAFAVVLLSRDFDKDYGRVMWKCATFQCWRFGAQVVSYTEEEVREFYFKGHITDIPLSPVFKDAT